MSSVLSRLMVVAVLLVAFVATADASLRGGAAAARDRSAAAAAGGQERPSFPTDIRLSERGARGQQAVDLLGSRLGDVAAAYGKTAAQLAALLQRDLNVRLDKRGRLYVEEEGLAVRTRANATDAAESGAGSPTHRELDVVDGNLVPDAQTFTLHSRPGASRTIYLDFDGATLTGTAWNVETGRSVINAPAFDNDGVVGSFSSAELRTIQYIWQRVAEDYAPFDVDVTTQAPAADALARSSSSDVVYGTTAVITTTAAYSCDCGGIAYVGVFNEVVSATSYKPALVFYDMLSPGSSGFEKYVAEAVSHEVGHNVGLDHDGSSTTEYYSGQGSWAPIMGDGYSKSVVQWSKGEYTGANNREDDLAVMQTFGLPLRADDYGNTLGAASPLTGGSTAGSVTTYRVRGVIHASTDVDYFSVVASAGSATLTLAPASRSPNLDAVIRLVNAAGTVLATADPSTSLSASLTTTLPAAGTYYVSVQGTGSGSPTSTGYSSYGSLGNYALTVSVPSSGTGAGSPPTAVATGTPVSGTAPLTVQLSSAGSADADGTITGYAWAFSEGGSSTLANPSRVYSTPGTYTATLTVTDNSGLTGRASVTITVGAAPVAKVRLEAATMSLTASYGRLSQQASASIGVTVTDANGVAVSGAVVSGQWSGVASSGVVSGTTGTNGVAQFGSASSTTRGTFTFAVTSVTVSGKTYDATTNSVSASTSVSW